MNAEEKVEMRMILIDEICEFFDDEDPERYEKIMDSTDSIFDRHFTGASKKHSEVLAETSKQIYAAILKGDDGISAADRFFLENDGAFKGDELETINSIRRAIWSFFCINSVKGHNQYEIIDTNNAATYMIRTIDELGLEEGSVIFTSIIPDSDQYWQFFGGLGVYGGEKAEKQVGLARKRKDMSDLTNSEFREYFRGRIAHFPSAGECEKAMTNFIRWQNGKRNTDNLTADPNLHQLEEFHLPEGMDGPVAMISTSAGIAIGSFLFAQFLDLVSGKFSKEKSRAMFANMLMHQDLFDDPILETIWLEYKSDFLHLACDYFRDVTDEESFVRKLLYYRPAIFDPKHLTITLMEGDKSVEDIWYASSPMLFNHNGTGYSSITEANREAFFPLLVAIESTITQFYRSHQELKDKDVLASLKDLRNNPDRYPGDGLAGRIYDEIRKVLIATRRYDKRDVFLAVSYIRNSVKRHHSSGGSQGYLRFIDGMLGDSGKMNYK